MRSRFILLLLAGAVACSLVKANHEHGWKVGQEYQYLVRSRTLTALNTLSKEYTGIIIKAIIKIQCNSPDMLRAIILMPQYAQIHKELPDGWETNISDQMLEYNDLPLSKEPFVIKMKHGVVRDLIMNKNVPTWEVNIVKSIVGQLQADTQGENARRTKETQVPLDQSPYAMFHVMEDTVGGKCEVLYDITPLPEYVIQDHPELVPRPELKGNGEHMYIMKTKNYEKCEQRVDYHFGISGDEKWDAHRRNNKNFMTRSSTSSIVISGNLKAFAIQSSVTRNEIVIMSSLMDDQENVVMNKMNLTLASISRVSTPIPAPSNPESTGNLVYTYNDPFSKIQHRRPKRPSVSPNSVEFEEGATWMDSNQDSGDVSDEANYGMLWQPKPTLREAPQNPLLPLFIGNKGKAVVLSDRIDAIENVKQLVKDIANEVEAPNTMPDRETLEKFTILSRLIGSMSYEQIQKAQGDLHSFHNEIRSTSENAWSVFRDAVADAGTGPALLTIKDWIEKKDIKKMEAAAILSRLPKTARMPTAEYVDTFFTMATNPEVQKEMFLNSSAILAFSELVHLAQVSNRSIHNNYPIHAFGRPTSKQNDVVITKYVPFLAEQLKKAIKDGDSPRIQVYIMALGSIGHPKILSVFEPYLEGKQQVSTFQRMMMVANLGKLAEHRPALVRSVLYKIYLNTWEAHQVRCAAVFLLMKTNPPLDMLLRMAKFTNYDYNAHVNSAVKSAIESAAELDDPKWNKFAKQAKDLLNPSYYSYYHSQSTVTEKKLPGRNLAYRIILDYIGSDDSIIPSAWYLSLQSIYGSFVAPPVEAGFMVSSMKNLLETLWNKVEQPEKNKRTFVNEVIKMLNIESDHPEQIEGSYFINTKYESHFFAFDDHTIDRISMDWIKDIIKIMEKKRGINMNRMMSYDINLSYPTETGLPFVYSFRMSFLHKLSASKNEKDLQFRFLVAYKAQGRVGFVTPFDQQRFVSGIDKNMQVFIPGKIEIKQWKLSESKMELAVTLEALKEDKNIRMIHYSVVPYIARLNVLSLRPALLEKNTRIIKSEDPTRVQIPPKSINSFFVIEVEAEQLLEDIEELKDNSISSWLIFPFSMGRDEYEKVDLYLKPDIKEDQAITFKTVFEVKDFRSDNPSESNDEAWHSGKKALMPKNRMTDSSVRRSEFLREVTKGMNSATAYVLDMALELPGNLQSRHILTMSLATSDPEEKYRTLFYWHTNILQQDIQFELCGNSQISRKPSSPFDFEKVLKNNPMEELSTQIRVGKTCSEGSEVNVQGKLTQTEDYKEKMKKMDHAKKCKERSMGGMKTLEACKRMVPLASIVNEMNITIDSDSNIFNYVMEEAVDLVKKNVPDWKSTRSKQEEDEIDENDEKEVTIHLRVSPDLTTLNASVRTPVETITFGDVDLTDLGVETETIEELLKEDLLDSTGICTIDVNEAITFDGKAYPLKLGKCSHVLTTTFPKRNDKQDELWSSPDMQLSVVAREVEDNKKELTIMLGEETILMKPSGSQLEVMVNDKDVEYSMKRSYQLVKDDETILEIYELPGPAVKLTSDKYDMDVVYDGERVQIKLPTDYQKSVRGLCGDLDGQPENDFLTPKNCVLKKPEEFVATYALKDNCDKETLRNARKAEKSICAKRMMRFSDVISDEEAGRSTTDWKQWGYHTKSTSKQCNSYRTMVIPKDNEICFTMRPVPICSAGCVPVEEKPKNYQLFCLPKNEGSLAMKRRIEQGANPDLSQRTPSTTKMITVPLECVAA